MVQAHVGDGSNRNMHITYSWDSDSSGGTAGALKHAESLLDETFFLTWGDSYVRVNHAEMFAVHRANASQPVVTMGVFRNENAYDSSNVEIEGDKVIRYKKG